MKRGVMRGMVGLAAALAVVCGFAGPAMAEVTVTFYGHEGTKMRGGFLYFPHAYVRMTGTLDDTGEAIDQAVGFTARYPGPWLLMASGPGVLSAPDARYISEGIAYVSVVIDDAAYRVLQSRLAHWGSREGSTYSLRRRNCITFVADIGRAAGLQTPAEDTLSPNGFLDGLATLNPRWAIAAPTADSGAVPPTE